MEADKAVQKVVDAFRDRRATGQKIGTRSKNVIRSRISGIKGAAERKAAREQAVGDIVDAVTAAGYKTDSAEINRLVKLHHVEVLLGIKETSNRVLRLLAPLITRRNEVWSLRRPEPSKDLAARLPDLDPDQIETAVRTILGRQPRKERKTPSARDKVMKLLADLDVQEQRVIYAALHKRFAKPPEPTIHRPPVPIVEPAIVAEPPRRGLFGGRKAG